MPASIKPANRRWILAILTAVLFPVVILHGTCIAVMGPGTWGSGLEEVQPVFQPPGPEARRLLQGLEAEAPSDAGAAISGDLAAAFGAPGRLLWSHRSGSRSAYLVDDPNGAPGNRRLFSADADGLREVAIPDDFIIARPQWVGSRIVCERWNPWAVPGWSKLRRYVASWTSPELRPEVALYSSDGGDGRWRYLMPGHSLTVAPDAERGALLRSGALLAGYYSVHIWSFDSGDTPAILSLREHGDRGNRSFALQWSDDSAALRIHGKTDGFARRGSHGGGGPDGIDMDLLYVVDEAAVYDMGAGG